MPCLSVVTPRPSPSLPLSPIPHYYLIAKGKRQQSGERLTSADGLQTFELDHSAGL
jgi:hypothetical protein